MNQEQETYDNLAPVEAFCLGNTDYQQSVDSTPLITNVIVDDIACGVVIHHGRFETVFQASVVYKYKLLEMEFYSKDDDKTLDYSQAYDEACKWAQHAAETGGDLKFNDNEESK